jgi:hypothetical protein
MAFARSFRHWTLRYVFDRLSLAWHERRNPNLPWLTADMVKVLDSWLRPTDVGLEWGSGRSTVWFAKRVAHLTSVEHDPVWASWVEQMLQDNDLQGRVTYHVLKVAEPEISISNYVNCCSTCPAESLDFCLVDGIARDDCAVACLDWIKPGGVVIVDNVNWYLPRNPKSRAPNSRSTREGAVSEKWKRFGESVCQWRCIWTSDGVTDTALWVKPMNPAAQ